MQEKEIWKDIPGYEGLYQVNQWGEIYSLYTNKKLKWSLHKDGYKQYNFHKNKTAYIMTAHRAVALAFIPNPNNFPLVNHKDENKLNCYIDNLEWCTESYNIKYNGNHSGQAQFNNYAKEFYIYDSDLNLIGKFKGIRKFSREHNLHSGSFSSVLNYNSKNPEKMRQYKGYCPIYFKL